MLGADPRNMNQPLDAGRLRGIGDRAGPRHMDGPITLAATLERDSRGVDDGVRTGDRRRDGLRDAQVGAHDGDLAHIARGLDRFGQFDPAHGDPHLQALLRQCPHNGPADKAATAEYRDLFDAHGCCL